MNILGVIPARGGSKGVPRKNVKLLNGKPLIAYTIESALASNVDKVVVSTDCMEIAEISKQYGVEVLMRPRELAKDDTPTLPVLQNIVSKLDERYDAIMTLQPTSPLRRVEDIDNSINIFDNNKNADSLVSVVSVPHNYMPEKLMTVNKKGYLTGGIITKRRQDMRAIYARNGAAIYITKTNNLNEYIIGGRVLPFYMSKINSIDIDDLDDFELVKIILESRR
jgi:CMP-N,N'-diacetyllegionaminic acid synthase